MSGALQTTADKIVFEVVVERRVDCGRYVDQEQRIAVWGRLCHDFGADVAGRTRPAIDEELLAEPLRQPLTDKPRDDVGCTTGREANDDVHWTRRIAERVCNASQGRKGRSSGCQVQKFATGQLHGDVPRV